MVPDFSEKTRKNPKKPQKNTKKRDFAALLTGGDGGPKKHVFS
jgi:hypothetical protein